MSRGEIFEYEPGWLACVGEDVTTQVETRLPGDARYTQGQDRIVRVRKDVLLLQAMYSLPPGEDAEALREILRRHVDMSAF